MEAQLAHIFDEIKELPQEKWGQVEDFVYHLNKQTEAEKRAALNAAFGTLKGEEAERFIEAIKDCERIEQDG